MTNIDKLLQAWLPILFSFTALVISFVTLAWTLYKDTIRKPKFKVGVSIKRVHRHGISPSDPFVALEALNLGPAPNRVMSVYCRAGWLRRKVLERDWSAAYVHPDFGHEAASQAACRVEVGDQATLVFPFNERVFLNDRHLVQIGVVDGFGRSHWAPRAHLKRMKRRYAETYPQVVRENLRGS